MARKLPWATTPAAQTKVKAKTPTAKPKPTPRPTISPKRVRSEDSSIDEKEVHENTEDSSSPARPVRRKRVHSRTPSTSPPLGPPEVQFMRDGYDADDIYIMVEDEFQSVAQSFTHHLHHAEYKRLQKKAREAPPKAVHKLLPEMSTGAKQQLEAKRLREKQNSALNDVTNSAQNTASRNEDDAEEQANDLWSGTHLAGLMAAGSQQSTALVGLEKIPSSTRAAKGFGRAEGDSPDQNRRPKSILEIFGGKEKSRQTILDRSSDIEEAEQDLPRVVKSPSWKQSGDKIEGRAGIKRRAPSKPEKSEPKAVDCSTTASRGSASNKNPKPGFRTRSALPYFDDGFDDLDGPVFEKPEKKYKQKLDSPEKRRLEKEKEKKRKASEIPTFLV